jgi:hypothetical protein
MATIDSIGAGPRTGYTDIFGTATRTGAVPATTLAAVGIEPGNTIIDQVEVPIPPVPPTTGQIWPRGQGA